MEAEKAYEELAPFYDDFTAYDEVYPWVESLLSELKRHGLTGNRLLDVGCGTGKSFLPMLARGWDVVGCDISPSMLEVARAKVGDAAQLHVADMRELPEFGEFDLVWAIGDQVNYLHSEEELDLALGGMRSNLAPAGLLVFDTSSLLTYQTSYEDAESLIFNEKVVTDARSGSFYDVHLESKVFGTDTKHVHRHRHFSAAEVQEALAQADLECLEVFGFKADCVLTQPLDESVHNKAIYISRAAQ